MNTASWIILAIVIVIVIAAIWATFFNKNKKSCCDTGDKAKAHGGCKSCCDCTNQQDCTSFSSGIGRSSNQTSENDISLS